MRAWTYDFFWFSLKVCFFILSTNFDTSSMKHNVNLDVLYNHFWYFHSSLSVEKYNRQINNFNTNRWWITSVYKTVNQLICQKNIWLYGATMSQNYGTVKWITIKNILFCINKLICHIILYEGKKSIHVKTWGIMESITSYCKHPFFRSLPANHALFI